MCLSLVESNLTLVGPVVAGTASGLTVEQCHEVMNNEFLKQMETMEQGWMQRVKSSLRSEK